MILGDLGIHHLALWGFAGGMGDPGTRSDFRTGDWLGC
jgi:hypothetical protein